MGHVDEHLQRGVVNVTALAQQRFECTHTHIRFAHLL
jgi:hypothetical protein